MEEQLFMLKTTQDVFVVEKEKRLGFGGKSK